MMFKSTRLAAGLAIASGLALLFPTAGNAQIRVTGGQLNGSAAFFVPGQNVAPGQTTPGTSLFDLSVQQLRIESENGTSTTSVFVPTSATFDDGGNRAVDAGDTGIVEGYLSGVALTQTGNLLPFSQRETVLSFQVDSFASSLNFNGTLLSPSVLGSAPLIFLPGLENATVEGSEFQATEGELQIGDLDTTLTDGLINLPSTLTFASSGGGNNPPTSTPILQRLNFRFEGEDLEPGSYLFNTTGDEINFVGEANQRFEINAQSAPASGRRTTTFRIRGEGGIVDATLGGTTARTTGQIDGTLPLDRFQIRGNGRVEGVLATFGAYGTDGVAFSSTETRGRIRYNFEQGSTRSQGEASQIQFTAFPGLGDISSIDTDTSDGYNFDDSFNSGSEDDSQDATSTCNICGTTININTPIQVGPYVTVFYPGQPLQVTGGTTTNNYTIALNLFNFTNYTSNTTLNVNLLALSSFDISQFSRQLRLLNSSDEVEFGSTTRRQRYVIRYQENGGDRYYVIVPRGSDESDEDIEVNDDDEFEATDGSTVITAYRLVGPSSRIFPSLVGLRQLSPDTTITSPTDDTDQGSTDDSSTVDTEDTTDDTTTVDTEDTTDDTTTVDTEDTTDDTTTVDTEDTTDDTTTVDTEDTTDDTTTTDTEDDTVDDGATLNTDDSDESALDTSDDATVEADDASNTITITVETDDTSTGTQTPGVDTDGTTTDTTGN